MRHLERELQTARRLARTPVFETTLLPFGVSPSRESPWGIARVSVDRRFYQPDPCGSAALIAPAYESGALTDLVATSLRPGHAMRLRRGAVNFLGYDNILRACDLREPLMLFEHGLSWVRHGGAGAVIVDWTRIAHWLANVPALACETAALANRVRAAFAQPIPLPDLYVSQPEETRHAA